MKKKPKTIYNTPCKTCGTLGGGITRYINGVATCYPCVLKENEDTVPTWIIELAERIVIDYANLSGRADNRPQFRGNVIKHLLNYTARPNNLINKETKCCMGGCGDINCKHC